MYTLFFMSILFLVGTVLGWSIVLKLILIILGLFVLSAVSGVLYVWILVKLGQIYRK
jgi:hypothetical protein